MMIYPAIMPRATNEKGFLSIKPWVKFPGKCGYLEEKEDRLNITPFEPFHGY